jgi:urea transport system permease protein
MSDLMRLRRLAERNSILPLIVLAGAMLLCLAHSRAFAADAGGVAPDLQAAVRSLSSSDQTVRQKSYDLIGDKGDARLIPALLAFRDGRLQDRDGRLIIYGDSVELNGQRAFPIVDAFTGKPVLKPDGSPDYLVRKSIDLSAPGMMRLPPARRAERSTIADLVSTLSLLDPDPATRLRSIRETGERAARCFPNTEDAGRLTAQLAVCRDAMKNAFSSPDSADQSALDALDLAIKQKPANLTAPAPDSAAIQKVIAGLAPVRAQANSPQSAIDKTLIDARAYLDRLSALQKTQDELPKYAAALHKQLDKDLNDQYSAALREAVAEMDVVLGNATQRQTAIESLGSIGTERAVSILERAVTAAKRMENGPLLETSQAALRRANRYQTEIHFAQSTFAGLSLSSILVLLALGLSIVFGLMDVINMAHGEFMMIGAFATFVVSGMFKIYAPGWFDYYPIIAIPAAFLIAGVIGYICEVLIIRHLYGCPLETLLATFGVGIILVQIARGPFGDNVSVRPPGWMEGGWEVMPDLFLARNRLYIILYCMACIAIVYFIVNRTKVGLLLRATTQNRQMAAALGVPTRRVDALTFAFGCGLAGLAGVAVPLYNKINPGVGGEYIVDSFMVVVVGGVGTLAGAIWAGVGLGFLSKYLEPLLASIPVFASSSSVIAKVLVLAAIVVFLTRRPQGLFPPKGRLADA